MTVVTLSYNGTDQLHGWALHHTEQGIRAWTVRATRDEVRVQRDQLPHAEARSHRIIRVYVPCRAVVPLP